MRASLTQDRSGAMEAGFTLVEMLVVITIIGLIMGLVGPRVLNYLAESKVKTAKIQIESLSAAVDLYYLDNGHYPSANDGLDALSRKPAGDESWNGPYLKTAVAPPDPWGRPYVYKFPGDHARSKSGHMDHLVPAETRRICSRARRDEL